MRRIQDKFVYANYMLKKDQNINFSGVKFLDELMTSILELRRMQELLLGEVQKINVLPEKNALSGEYFTEKEAGNYLKKKSTWFFNMRKSGMLPYSKVGGKVFYAKKDIIRLIQKGRTQF